MTYLTNSAKFETTSLVLCNIRNLHWLDLAIVVVQPFNHDIDVVGEWYL